MVLTYSVRIPRVPTYSGYSPAFNDFNYGTFTLFHESFQISSSIVASPFWSPLPRTYCYMRFGLVRFRSPLLSESLIYFLFLRVMRCFSSPGSPLLTMDSSIDTTTLLVVSSLIRISVVQRLFATTHSFSQLVTSFFGAMYQGIHLYALCSLFFWYISISPSLISFYLDLSYKNSLTNLFNTFFVSTFLIFVIFCLLYF